VGHHGAGNEVVDSVPVGLAKCSCVMTRTLDERWPSNKFTSTAPVTMSQRYLDVNADVTSKWINCNLPSDFVNRHTSTMSAVACIPTAELTGSHLCRFAQDMDALHLSLLLLFRGPVKPTSVGELSLLLRPPSGTACQYQFVLQRLWCVQEDIEDRTVRVILHRQLTNKLH